MSFFRASSAMLVIDGQNIVKILEFVRGDSCLKQCPLLAGRCTRFSALLGSWDSEITGAGLPL
jgi:hypothetical protein